MSQLAFFQIQPFYRAAVGIFLAFIACLSWSCDGPIADSGPTEKDIWSACKSKEGNRWAGGSVSNITRGSTLVSDGSLCPLGTKIYPVRVQYSALIEKPLVWDAVTGLPRRELVPVPVMGEFRFYLNEFGEWKYSHIKTTWLCMPEFPNDPRNAQWKTHAHNAYMNANISRLEEYLNESKLADRKNGVGESNETKLRKQWLADAISFQKEVRTK